MFFLCMRTLLFLVVQGVALLFALLRLIQCTIFSPITEAMRVKMKNMRQKVAGSLNTRMPMSTVPTAPMPVQMGYAVPMGMTLVAFDRKSMLRT